MAILGGIEDGPLRIALRGHLRVDSIFRKVLTQILIISQIPLRWEGKNEGAALVGNPNLQRVASRQGGG